MAASRYGRDGVLWMQRPLRGLQWSFDKKAWEYFFQRPCFGRISVEAHLGQANSRPSAKGALHTCQDLRGGGVVPMSSLPKRELKASFGVMPISLTDWH